MNEKEFLELLENSSLEEMDQKNIQFLLEYFQKKHPSLMASRSYLFSGAAGTGKTFLAVKLLEALNQEVIYLASTDIGLTNGKKCFSFEDLLSQIKNDVPQIIFLDDLYYLFNRIDEIEIEAKDKRGFLSILDLTKKNPLTVLIATINEMMDLDERMLDRIEVKIDVGLPSEAHKQKFLEKQFPDHFPDKLCQYLAINSIGYNYRDLPELVRMAYRLGGGKVSPASLQEALKKYTPTQLHGFKVENGLKINFKQIIGKEEAVRASQRLIKFYRNEEISKKLGLKRENLFLFHGPAGTGKTFLAKALAGEIGFPLINIKARDIYHGRINQVVELAKRYRNCIIFIDEAEKLFGNSRHDSDHHIIGEFNSAIEGGYGQEVKAIFILAMNELSRFGEALQDRFIAVEFELPSYEERAFFYENKVKETGVAVDCDYLAKITDNRSFREMEKAWNELMFSYMENPQEIDKEVIDSVLKEFNQPEKNSIFG